MPKAAAIYCRISSDPRDTRRGVDRQEELCRALIESHGWTLAGVYTDNDVSASGRAARPAYRRLLADIESGRVGVVVTWHPDRLYRQLADLEELIKLADAHSVKFDTVTAGELDLRTSTGRMIARVVGTLARYEVERTTERVQAAHDDLRRKGMSGSGVRSFGYEHRPDDASGSLRIVPPERNLIREAAKRIIAGETVWSVASDWNRRGLRTLTGRPWRTSILMPVLKSPRIAALRQQADGTYRSAVWPPILPRADWDRLQRVLARRPARNGGYTARKFVLAGFLHCGRCGKVLVSGRRTAGRGLVRLYRCAPSPGDAGCGLQITAEAAEAVVLGRTLSLVHYLSSETPPPPASDDAALASLYADLEADWAALDQLETDYRVERTIDRAQYFAVKALLEARVTDRQREVAELTGAPAGTWAALVAAARDPLPSDRLFEDRALFDEVRNLVGTLFERITVKPADASKARSKADPDRIDLEYTPAGEDAAAAEEANRGESA